MVWRLMLSHRAVSRALRGGAGAPSSSSGRPLSTAVCEGDGAPPPILVEEDLGGNKGVLLVTLNRPEKLNSFTLPMGAAFQTLMYDVAAGRRHVGTRAIVVSGAGRGFSAGGDMAFLEERTRDTPRGNVAKMMAFYKQWLSILEVPVPTIAAIHGPAVGAGACFALACDLRIAAEGASFGFNFVQLGFHPGMGSSHLLPALLGPQAAAEMLLTGGLYSAEEARARGLVLSVEVGPAACVARATALAAQIASGNEFAARQTLETLRTARVGGLEAALEREAQAQALNFANGDMHAGVRRAMERWNGGPR